MASAFSHALGAVAIITAFAPPRVPRSFWWWAILLAILPDFDVIAFQFGIPYESPFGHRGFTHSILFALVTGLVFAAWQQKMRGLALRLYTWLLFSLVVISHAMLDAMTTGGLGMAFYWPFENTRYFFPWRVINVSPLTISQFFGEWGLRVIKSELVWVGIPSLVLICFGLSWRGIFTRGR